jgi:hypothetical protein
MARPLVHPRRSAALANLYPTPCTIERGGSADDGTGGWTDDPSPDQIAAMCRWGASSDLAGDERVIADRLASEAPVFVAFPAGTDVRTDDRIVVAGRELAVKAVPAPGSFEGERIALCTETT